MRLLLPLALALAAAGCKDSGQSGPMPQPTRAPPPGFEDVDTAERPDAAPSDKALPRQTVRPAAQPAAADDDGARGRSPPRTR